jgi:hypothetical protein
LSEIGHLLERERETESVLRKELDTQGRDIALDLTNFERQLTEIKNVTYVSTYIPSYSPLIDPNF